MIAGVVSIIVLLFLVFFAIYKKDMIMNMFSLNASLPANKFQRELEQTTNLIIKRLETQISHLEYLLQEADEKILSLENQLQKADAMEKQYVKENGDTQVESHFGNMPVTTEPVSIEAYKDNLEHEHIMQTAIDKGPEAIGNDKHRLILAMADQGYNITEIAKATGVGKGEVMLLLQLNKK